MFKDASMNLREWLSNRDMVNDYSKGGQIRAKCYQRFGTFLGLKTWHNTFKAGKSCEHLPRNLKKKIILKVIASVFDLLANYSEGEASTPRFLEQKFELGRSHGEHWNKTVMELYTV